MKFPGRAGAGTRGWHPGRAPAAGFPHSRGRWGLVLFIKTPPPRGEKPAVRSAGLLRCPSPPEGAGGGGSWRRSGVLRWLGEARSPVARSVAQPRAAVGGRSAPSGRAGAARRPCGCAPPALCCSRCPCFLKINAFQNSALLCS